MKTIVVPEMKDFSWINILMQSQTFKQSEFNPSIFTVKSLADIAVDENGIAAIHPGDERTLNKVAEELQKTINNYYKKEASVTITEDYIINVNFI